MATMRDVAHHAGVSAKTVSRVINNDRYVSADVRERVERAIDELQYVPNMLAVTFRAGRDAAIGVAVPGVADPFFASIIDAVEREASRRDVAVILTSVGWEPSHEQRSIEAVLKRQVAGMIICPVGRDMSYLRPWQKRTPLVFVDREPGRLTADAVVQDDVGGGRDATSHLISHGHRSIAFMGDDTVTGLLRLEGCQQALQEAGLPSHHVHVGALDIATLTAALRRMLDAPDPPTACVLVECPLHHRAVVGVASPAAQGHRIGRLRRLPDGGGAQALGHGGPSGRRRDGTLRRRSPVLPAGPRQPATAQAHRTAGFADHAHLMRNARPEGARGTRPPG